METETNTNKMTVQDKLIYVEPMFSNGVVDDVPITPDYTDFCVSFDLIIKKVDRRNYLNDYSRDGNVEEFSLSFSSNSIENLGSVDNNANFLFSGEYKKGENDDSFLTVFYTDISPEDYRKKNIVEGLGVTNININFDNRFCPTIKMKFVDVRGSGLFGREEIIHENKKITSENIFSCFFSIPYPQMRLQVKGFYGQAVTFQLVCVDFKGRLNSRTGNFEADVTFLGYDFGILSNIPFRYIVYAPYCDYVGKQYWQNKVTSEEWKLSDGSNPVTLIELNHKIKSFMVDVDEGNVDKYLSDGEWSEVKNYSENKSGVLNGINQNYKNFINELYKKFDRHFDLQDGRILLLSKKPKITIDNKPLEKLNESVKEYNKTYPQDKLDNDFYGSGYVKNSFDEKYKHDNITAGINGDGLLFCDLTDSYGDDIIIRKNDIEGLNDFQFKQEEYYCVCFDDCSFRENLTKKINEQENKKEITRNELIDLINDGVIKINKILGINPCIGDIFKITLCHLETFIQMMNECVTTIYGQIETGGKNNIRSIDKLKGNLGSDLPSDSSIKHIIPFPGIYKKEDNKNVIGWIKDVAGGKEMEEAKLVDSLYDASLFIGKQIHKVGEEDDLKYIPLLPFDADKTTCDGLCCADIPSLSAYLAFRFFAINSLMNYNLNGEKREEGGDEYFRLGEIEGYNFIKNVGDEGYVKEKLFDKLGGVELSDFLTYIPNCWSQYGGYEKKSENGNGYYDFELNSFGNTARHEIKTKDKYVYLPLKNDDNLTNYLLPCNVDYINQNVFSEYIGFDSNKKGYIIKDGFWKSEGGNLLFCMSLPQTDDTEKVKNKNNFELYAGEAYGFGETVTKKVTTGYWALQNDVIKEDGYVTKRTSGIASKFFRLNPEDFNRYVNKTATLFSDEEIDDSCFYPQNRNDDVNTNKILDDYDYHEKSVCLEKTDDDIVVNGRRVNHSKVWIGCFESFCINNNNPDKIDTNRVSLFGNPYYYEQNKIVDENLREKAKSLLFLHTLGYNLKEIQYHLFSKNMTTSMPYGLAALIGGLIWRDRYLKKQINDSTISLNNPLKVFDVFYNDGKIKCYTNNLVSKEENENKFIPPMLFEDNNDTVFVLDASTTRYSAGLFEKVVNLDWISGLSPLIKNKFVDLFEHFVSNHWGVIRNSFELKRVGGNGDEITISGSDDFEEFCNEIYGDNSWESLKKTNFPGNYMYYKKDNINGLGQVLRLINHKNNEKIQKLIKKVVSSEVIVSVCMFSSKALGEEDYLKYDVSKYKQYCDGFVGVLKRYAGIDDGSKRAKELDENVDIKIGIYDALKQVWDKWLLFDYIYKDSDNGYYGLSKYKVEDYFANNFRFIDSFYVDISDRLNVNCEKLSRAFESKTELEGGYVLQFLSYVASDNNCNIFGIPTYTFNNKEDLQGQMEKIFKPIPYNERNDISAHNKVVVVYSYKPSEIYEMNQEYNKDGFDVWDEENRVTAFGDLTSNSVNGSYKIPSFGVSYGYSNNAIFKNIEVGMANPTTTEQSLLVNAEFAKVDKGTEKRISYYGQDIYPLYSGYSYTCDVEMMGNAQIVPLMYFQLTNVPMFRGSYMIYKVSHDIKPGSMVTRFTGLKMSTKHYPYVNRYFQKSFGSVIEKYEDEEVISVETIEDYTTQTTIKPLNIAGGQQGRFGLKDMLNRPGHNDKPIIGYDNSETKRRLTENMEHLLYHVINPLVNDFMKSYGHLVSKISLTSGLRRHVEGNNGDNTNSDHYEGAAADLQVFDNNGEKYRRLMFLLGKHLLKSGIKFRQLIFEDCGEDKDPRKCGLVHIAAYPPAGLKENDRQVYSYSTYGTGESEKWTHRKDKILSMEV